MKLLTELNHFIKVDVDFDDDENIQDKNKVYKNLLKVYEKKRIKREIAEKKANIVFELCNFKR